METNRTTLGQTAGLMSLGNAFSLEGLLINICTSLQLSPTQNEKADGHYLSVGKWLSVDGNVLSRLKPIIYSQGSFRIGTPTKPIRYNEFDLDSVVEYQVDPSFFGTPIETLNILEYRLREHETYRDMVERKNRCIRLNYAGDFHFDILPACPDPYLATPGAVLVPDREMKSWKASNPKGYASWFLERAHPSTRRLEAIEPLPQFETTFPLQQVVQLLKRNRDLFFKEKDDLTPASIVITTLAAEEYIEKNSITDAMDFVMGHLVSEVLRGRMEVLNPTNPKELLSELWLERQEAYSGYVDWVYDLSGKWNQLKTAKGLHNIEKLLTNMFGEAPTKEALLASERITSKARSSGNLFVSRGIGGLLTEATSNSTPVRKNTFFGD